MRFSKILILILSIIFIISPLISIFVKLASAQTSLIDTASTFKLNLASNQPSANANLTVDISIPEGETMPNNIDLKIPIGWDIKGGTEIVQEAQIGTGIVKVNYLGKIYDLDINAFNEQETFGAKARWKIVIGQEPFELPEGIIYWSVTGSDKDGFVLNINSPIIDDFDTPFSFNFTFFGKTSSNESAIINPVSDGEYIYYADINYSDGKVVTLPLSLPISSTKTGVVEGMSTTPGDNVTNEINSATITFTSVTTLGSTSVTTTADTPDAGTGQFQVSKGLYYDFDTTAKIDCPCFVTLPYDPGTTDKPSIYHLEDGVWVDVTTSIDNINSTVTGMVMSFSYFATGQPDFGLEFMDPISALQEVSNPMRLNRNRTLPVNFTLTNSDGNFILRNDIKVQIINNETSTQVGLIDAAVLEKHYKANLDLKSLNLPDGTYKIRVIVGNTVYTPTLLFNPV